MVTFCKFPLKNFILSVFFLFQPVTNCHQFTPPGSTAAPAKAQPSPCRINRNPGKAQPTPCHINPGSTISTPTFSAPPKRKCQKKLQTYQTFALPNPHSPRARAQYLRGRAGARGNIRAARSGCARPRRRVYNIAAGLVICCRAGVLLLGWRPAAGLAICCRAAAGLVIRPDPVQLVQIAQSHSVVLCAILQIALRSVDIRTPACYHAITPSETATDQRSRRPAGPRVAIWARRHDPQKQEVKT